MRYVVSGVEEIISDLDESNIQSIVKQPMNEKEAYIASKELIATRVDGIIMLSNDDVHGLKKVLDETNTHDIPIAGIVSEPMDGTPLVGIVRSNGFVLGRMAAQFLSLCVDKSKQLAVFLPDNVAVIHRECYESFVQESMTQGMMSAALYKTSFRGDKISYKVTQEALENNKQIGGIYVASNNAVGVCKMP